jgi:hypothetical protein
MRRSAFVSLALVSALWMTGCAQAGFVQPAAGALGELEALGRAAIGGQAYAKFKIAPDLPKADGQRAAVKLTYLMNDDTKHQSPQSLGMLRMMDDLPQKNVHNVVFRDGGEMGDSKIYYMAQADKALNTVRNPQSPLAPGVGEVQSNNPKVFSQVLGYALDNYPGRRKYLQIYTHGGGVFGIGTDETQTDLAGKPLPKEQQVGIMRMPDFAEALRQGLKGRQLDMIYFRACLMGNVEALYELRGTTKYALASEDVSYSVDNSNLTMTKQFDDLAAKDEEPAAIAKAMAIQANAKNPERKDGSFSGYTTMAAIDMTKLDELKTAINVLARALTAAMKTESQAIVAAYDAVPTVQGKDKAEAFSDHMRDLWAFTAQLDQRVKDKAVQSAVAQVRSAQRAAMLHAKDTFGSAANGLSIFMPARAELGAKGQMTKFLAGRYQETKFAKDSAWDEFLEVVPGGGAN